MHNLRLPTDDGRPEPCRTQPSRAWRRRGGSFECGDTAAYHAILAPTVPLARYIFEALTQFYKTGIVFMAYLNPHQSHFSMVGGRQSARSIMHVANMFRPADATGLLNDPNEAAARMKAVRRIHGIDG